MRDAWQELADMICPENLVGYGSILLLRMKPQGYVVNGLCGAIGLSGYPLDIQREMCSMLRIHGPKIPGSAWRWDHQESDWMLRKQFCLDMKERCRK